MIVECKRYAPGNAIPGREIRDIMGALQYHGAQVAIFVTTSRSHVNASWKQSEHWAAVYLDGRLAEEDVWEPYDGLFLPMPDRIRRECAEVICDCWRQRRQCWASAGGTGHSGAAMLGVRRRPDCTNCRTSPRW